MNGKDNVSREFELLRLVEEEAERVSIYTDAQEAVETLRRNVAQKILKRIEKDLEGKTHEQP